MSFNEGDRVRVISFPVQNDESSGIIGLEGTVLAPYKHDVPYPVRVHLDGELDWDVFKEEELELV